MIQIFSSILLFVGVIFVLVGAWGLVRMQDVFMRMSASTKTTIVGSGFMLLGVIFFFSDVGVTGRALAIFLFTLATAPISAHMIGRAAYSDKVELWSGTQIDQLEGMYDDENQTLSSGEFSESDTWKPAVLDDHII